MTKQEKLAAYLAITYYVGCGDGESGKDVIFSLSEKFPLSSAGASDTLLGTEGSKLGDKSLRDHFMVMAGLILQDLE